MAKTLAEMPAVYFDDQHIWSGELPTLQARFAVEHGPIYKRIFESGPDAGRVFVFMVGPEANRFVFHTHRDHFSHELGWTPIVGEDFGRGLLNMDDPDHARHRKMWNPAFTSACMEVYLPVMLRVIAERTRAWPTRDTVDVYAEAREITFDAAAAALAGFEPGPDVDRLRQLFYVLLHGFDPVQETRESFRQRWVAARSELTNTLLQLIARRRVAPLEEQGRDVLSMITHAKDEQGQALSDEQVLAHLNILLIAGHETTTTLGAWALQMLATRPEQCARVRAEVDALLPDPRGPIGVEALRAMKQLDNFIKETGRLYSPVINVPRGVVKDFEFGGYSVPAGTQVRLALAACHRLPAVWSDPARFDPDRFAPPREEDKRQQYALVTFGGGARICIGVNFANIETKALAAYVLRNYQLEPIPGQRLAHAGFWTAELSDGIAVRFSKREQGYELCVCDSQGNL